MKKLPCIALACLLPVFTAQAGEWRGNVTAELTGFPEQAAHPGQYRAYASLAVEPEYFHQWNNRYDLFTFKPYLMLDSHDDNRSHGDIRELSWIHAAPDWETNIGISKVYWA